ncbi:MAG: hypothetical protein RL304_441 [Verrucomicrobiota bacterium]|jgi:hypothetical protein
MRPLPLLLALLAGLTACQPSVRGPADLAPVPALTAEQATEYKLDPKFYRKATLAEGILIATSGKVADHTHREAAYQFSQVMRTLRPDVAARIREKKVLCVIVAHDELTSDVPQFASDKKGKELDFYNWRQRGFLTRVDGRQVVLFAEEDVMEYEGGMQAESILIHEFGHVIQGAGFTPEQHARAKAAFAQSKEAGRYQDGYAAQRFRRVQSATPVSLLDALVAAFPDQPRAFLAKCLDAGDILVNGQASHARVTVTKDDKVLIVFGGPKQCYAATNPAEYWAEGVQDWFDTNRTMDHDHSLLRTRDQLKAYDPPLAALCAEVLGDTPWRFVSPRLRAGQGHLAGYDPTTAPKVAKLPHIDAAAQDYYDTYWKDYWRRLHAKHDAPAAK